MAMWRLEVQDLALPLIPLALLYLRIRSKDIKRRLNLSFHRTLHNRKYRSPLTRFNEQEVSPPFRVGRNARPRVLGHSVFTF